MRSRVVTAAGEALAWQGSSRRSTCASAWRGVCQPEGTLADPDHEEHEDLLDWLGLDSAADFDPARFRLDEVNARLSQLI